MVLFSAGIHNADSIVLDPHKGLFQPHGCGSVLFRDGLPGDGEYEDRLTNPLEEDPPLRGFPLWFSLNVYGEDLVRKITCSKIQMAQHIYRQLEECEHLEMGPAFSLSKVTFRVRGNYPEKSNQMTTLLMAAIEEDDLINISTTTLNEFTFIHMCTESLRCQISDVILFLDVTLTQVGSAISI